MSQLGASMGIAIVGTVVSSSMATNLQQLPTSLAEKLQFGSALQHGFLAILTFTVMALLAAFFLKDVPLSTNSQQEVPGQEPALTSS